MNRRKFLQGLLGGIATVAIATKLAPKFPEFKYKTYGKEIFISAQEMQESAYAELGELYAKALARSMQEMKENVAMRVFHDAERDGVYVQGVSAEEFYV